MNKQIIKKEKGNDDDVNSCVFDKKHDNEGYYDFFCWSAVQSIFSGCFLSFFLRSRRGTKLSFDTEC